MLPVKIRNCSLGGNGYFPKQVAYTWAYGGQLQTSKTSENIWRSYV